MSTVVGAALDDFVGSVLGKKDDAGFLALVRFRRTYEMMPATVAALDPESAA